MQKKTEFYMIYNQNATKCLIDCLDCTETNVLANQLKDNLIHLENYRLRMRQLKIRNGRLNKVANGYINHITRNNRFNMIDDVVRLHTERREVVRRWEMADKHHYSCFLEIMEIMDKLDDIKARLLNHRNVYFTYAYNKDLIIKQNYLHTVQVNHYQNNLLWPINQLDEIRRQEVSIDFLRFQNQIHDYINNDSVDNISFESDSETKMSDHMSNYSLLEEIPNAFTYSLI